MVVRETTPATPEEAEGVGVVLAAVVQMAVAGARLARQAEVVEEAAMEAVQLAGLAAQMAARAATTLRAAAVALEG